MSGRHREPITIDDTWMSIANCAGIEPIVFFAPDNEAEAKAICAGCEVRAECLAASFALNARDGIWGGMNWDERKRHRRIEQRLARLGR